MSIPVLITLGNGITWAVAICVELGSPGKPWVFETSVQPALLRLIQGLPAFIGFDMKSKIEQIETLFFILSGEEIKVKPYIDLEILAVIAGCFRGGWRMGKMLVTNL